MKKSFLIVIFLFFNFNLFPRSFKINANCDVYDFYNEIVDECLENEIIDVYKVFLHTNESGVVSYLGDIDEDFYIPVQFFDNLKTKNTFSLSFLASCGNGKYLFPDYAVKAVDCQNRNIIAINDKQNCDALDFVDDEYVSYWYEYTPHPLLISNIALCLGSIYGVSIFWVDEINKVNENEYSVLTTAKIDLSSRMKNTVYPDVKNGQQVKFRLKKDGDYLYVYVGNETKPRQICCYVDNELRDAVSRLVEVCYCNKVYIQWPKHADGTCEFER